MPQKRYSDPATVAGKRKRRGENKMWAMRCKLPVSAPLVTAKAASQAMIVHSSAGDERSIIPKADTPSSV
jgi:hypothetical protein